MNDIGSAVVVILGTLAGAGMALSGFIPALSYLLARSTPHFDITQKRNRLTLQLRPYAFRIFLASVAIGIVGAIVEFLTGG
ncbi:MAG: hypothetical protein HZC02_01940 [Candidatus Levybacteria bacterium]|nr:hypothetical protein [Candidatus Levybacteria bacterium]